MFDADSRFEWAHLTTNFLGLHEAIQLEGENPSHERIAMFYDNVTGEKSGKYLTLIL